MRLSVLPHVCVLAAAALPVACATTPTTAVEARRSAPPAPPAPPLAAASAASADPQAILGLARFAGRLDLPLAPAIVDRTVRWQRGMRDLVHGLRDRLQAWADDTGVVIADLTVLAIEPVAHTESSGFGWRDDPIRHTRRFHSGADFRGKHGTPVVAAGDGVVTFSGRRGGYGNVIDIDHGGGVVTRYAHLRRIETRNHAAIVAGDKIGQVGSTGRTTGPHLHFEVRIEGLPVSPNTALTIAAIQRQSPLAGRLAALSLSPELQATAESAIDPPKNRAKRTKRSQRPERPGRGKRKQVLW